jgi:hypothetical protein
MVSMRHGFHATLDKGSHRYIVLDISDKKERKVKRYMLRDHIQRVSGNVSPPEFARSLSLKRVYLYRKLIILNEKNKSALNG